MPKRKAVEEDSDFVEPGFLRIKVVGQHTSNNHEIHFKVKRDTPLGKIKKIYAKRAKLSVKVLRFLFDGDRVDDKHTPEQLNMEDQDVIDVCQAQYSG